MEESINEKVDRELDCEQELADSPESPDPSLNSDVFIVEKPNVGETSSITSSDIARFVEEATVGDDVSYFETPPGPLRRWEEPNRESLNDLNEERGPAVMSLFRDNAADPDVYELQYPFYQPRFPEKIVRPMTVALSQSAPGLGCGCLRVGLGEDMVAPRGSQRLSLTIKTNK